jgi:hypothetical protein
MSDFLKNAPFDDRFPAKLKVGLAAELPALPEGLGDCFFATDTSYFYVSNEDADGWVYAPLAFDAALLRTVIFGLTGGFGQGGLLTDSGSALVTLPVGSDTFVLTANSAESTGLEWVDPSTLPGGGGGATTLGGLDNVDPGADGTGKGRILARFDDDFWKPFGNSSANDGSALVQDDSASSGWTLLPFLLAALLDVDISGATPGDVPTWNGSSFDVVPPPATSPAAFSGCFLKGNGSFGVSVSSSTELEWDVETYDTDGFHSTVSDKMRMVAPANGYYKIAVQLDLDTATGGIDLRIYSSTGGGTEIGRILCSDADQSVIHLEVGPFYFTASEYAVANFLYTSGSGFLLNGASNARMWLVGT